jgi:hypothetical protein
MINFDTDQSRGFVVFSDEDIWEPLDGQANIVLVDGDFNADADKAIRGLLRAYDDARSGREMAAGQDMHPMDDLVVETDDSVGPVRMRAIPVAFLLRFYLDHQRDRARLRR